MKFDPGAAIAGWLQSLGLGESVADILGGLILAFAVLVVAVLVNWGTRKVLARRVYQRPSGRDLAAILQKPEMAAREAGTSLLGP